MRLEYRHLQWLEFIWDASLTPKAKLVAAYLTRFMNKDHHSAWPAMSRIQGQTGLSLSSVVRALAELEEAGWLTRVPGGLRRGKEGGNSEYTVVFPREVEEALSGVTVTLMGPVPLSSRQRGGVTVTTEKDPPIVTKTTAPLSQRQTNQSIESDKINTTGEAGFAEFWSGYPRKVAKPAAAKAWRRLSEADRTAAMKALANYSFPADPQYTPHPATWLNARRWEDDPLPAKAEPEPWYMTEAYI